jgi:hypothetical protein
LESQGLKPALISRPLRLDLSRALTHVLTFVEFFTKLFRRAAKTPNEIAGFSPCTQT